MFTVDFNNRENRPPFISFEMRVTGTDWKIDRFWVPGQPIGYCSSVTWSRVNQYHAYRDKIRLYANTKSSVKLPLFADRERPAYIFTHCVFSLNLKTATGRPMVQHSDPGNVQKGVVDALFLGGGGDRHTGGGFTSPHYSTNEGEIGCMVTIVRPLSLVVLGGVRKPLKEQTPYLPGIASPLRPKKKKWGAWRRKKKG